MSTEHRFTKFLMRTLRYVYTFSLGVQVLFLVAIALNAIVIQEYTVHGFSMYPTLYNGDHVLVNRLAYTTEDPKLGDIVVFRYGSNPTTTLVKRVAGVPGMTEQTNLGMITLGPGQYFMLGDNAPESTDSRTFGPVLKSQIIGKLFCYSFKNRCTIL